MRGLDSPKNIPDLLNSLNFQNSHFTFVFAMIFLFLIDPFLRNYNVHDVNYHQPIDIENWLTKGTKENIENIYYVHRTLSTTYYLGVCFLLCVCSVKVYWEALQYLAKHLSYNVRNLAIFYSFVETCRLLYYFIVLNLFLSIICNGNVNSFWNPYINLNSISNVVTLRNFLELNYFSLNFPSSSPPQNHHLRTEDYLINGNAFVHCLNASYDNEIESGLFSNSFFKMDINKKKIILDFYNQNMLFINNQSSLNHQGTMLNLKRSFLTFFYSINNENFNLLNQKLQREIFVISGFSFALYYLIFQYFVPIIRINYIIRKDNRHNHDVSADYSSSSDNYQNYGREYRSMILNNSPRIEEISSSPGGGRYSSSYDKITHLQEPFHSNY